MANQTPPSPRKGSIWPTNPYCGFTDDSYRYKALAVQSICKLLGRIVFWGAAAYLGFPVVVAPMANASGMPAFFATMPSTPSLENAPVTSPTTRETASAAK